jgi:RHS repeat-associated protein
VVSYGQGTFTPRISEHRGGVSKFLHQDYLGSTKQITGSNQTVTDTRQYDAFGLQTGATGSSPTPFGFAGGWGYQQDSTGLQLLGHRYYDPSTGRFLTRDPIKDGRNWYGYCGNNPVVNIDPSGFGKVKYALYVLIDMDSVVRKWGMTGRRNKRYSQAYLKRRGLTYQEMAESDSKRVILDQERLIVGESPGPDNLEHWAGKPAGLLQTLAGFFDPTFVSSSLEAGEVFGDVVVHPMVAKARRGRQKSLERWMDPELGDEVSSGYAVSDPPVKVKPSPPSLGSSNSLSPQSISVSPRQGRKEAHIWTPGLGLRR